MILWSLSSYKLPYRWPGNWRIFLLMPLCPDFPGIPSPLFSSNFQLMAAPRCDPWHHGTMIQHYFPSLIPGRSKKSRTRTEQIINSCFPLPEHRAPDLSLSETCSDSINSVKKKPTKFQGICRHHEISRGNWWTFPCRQMNWEFYNLRKRKHHLVHPVLWVTVC